jgi:mannosidase alpha-like ER degradation enhancer 1
VVGNKTEFARSVRWLGRHVSFDLDLRVNVFECNIRVLGGLLSAHLLAADPSLGLMVDTDGPDGPEHGYDGVLLRLAEDLGRRLLPAFDNPTARRPGPGQGLPYAWVHLQRGLLPGEVTETCTAVAGTLLLEFGLLSHLTGDRRFFEAAHGALMAVWSLRSSKDLVGNTLDVQSRAWTNPNAGIGA